MASESPNRTPNGFVVFIGSAAAFVVVAAVFAVTLAAKKPVDEVDLKRAAQRLEARTKLDAEAHQKLHSLGWADKAKGTAHVPIADAMTMVVAELAAKKPAPSSVKVEPPLPMPVIDPKSAEPPPAALPSAPQGADMIRFAPPAAAETPAAQAPVAPPAAPEKPAEPAPAPVPAVPPAPPVEPAPAPAPAPAAPPAPPVEPAPGPAPAIPPAPPAPAPEPPANPTENPAPTK